MDQLPWVLAPCTLGQGAATEQSCTHCSVLCRLTAFQGSWERLVGCCVARDLVIITLCHVYRMTKQLVPTKPGQVHSLS